MLPQYFPRLYLSSALAVAILLLPIFAIATGCGTDPDIELGHSKDFSISSSGGERQFRVYLPVNYDQKNPTPLIISYHSRDKTMSEQQELNQFSNELLNQHMIAAYPQGLKGSDGQVNIYTPPCQNLVIILIFHFPCVLLFQELFY